MKTYYIDGNAMHLAGSQDDISESFFGSECPESNATVAQRQDAIRFWLSEGWMDAGDVVVWDGIRYIVGEEDKIKHEKKIVKFLNDIGVDFDEFMENYHNENPDFEIGGYRFIDEGKIDDIQVEEMESDPYILGCFADWAIADVSDLSYDIVQALKESEKFEIIGQHLIDNDCVEELQRIYVANDGYGHHFAHYDFETLEDILTETGYYVFRV